MTAATNGNGDSFYCINDPGAAVPEMSDYAAVAFITLALLIGWRVRRGYRPAP